jgi:hypothetical protein
MTDSDLKQRAWWDYLESDLQELLLTAEELIKDVGDWKGKFHDYSFIVFPAAKAYEGFLKKLFLDRGFIDKKDYYGKHFRIGKSLNPSLPKRLRDDDYVYDDLVKSCEGDRLAKMLWKTWRNCRNQLFHWFPDEKKVINYQEAKQRVERVIDSIEEAFEGCKMRKE